MRRQHLPSYFFVEKERRGGQTSASDVWQGWSFHYNAIKIPLLWSSKPFDREKETE
jgi:hypothetical protein